MCRRCWNLVAPAQMHSSFSGAITMARAGGDFDGALRAAIHAFKYEGRRSLARPLGRLMQSTGSDLLRDAHCVVPVPLHAWRHFRRGFNQASDLAKVVGIPVAHVLWRARATTSQSGLTAAARRRNVRGAFQMSPLLSVRRREDLLRDRIAVLVDDVRTTGATLHACAEVLLAAGAREVRALTAAARDI
jgi:ComF family protein